MDERITLHVDSNAFYASAEELLHPERRAAPLGVCGNPERRPGVIFANNELAKGFACALPSQSGRLGKSALTWYCAPRSTTFTASNVSGSTRFMGSIPTRWSGSALTKSYLDVTGSLQLFGDALTIARRILKAGSPYTQRGSW